MTASPGAGGVRCALCAGALRPGVATIPFVRGDRTVVIRDVPADVCGDCGEPWLSAGVTDRLQELVEQLEALDAEVSVTRFRGA